MGRGLIFNLKSRHRHWGFRGLRETRRDKILLALNCIKLVSVSKSERERKLREIILGFSLRVFLFCLQNLHLSRNRKLFSHLSIDTLVCSLFLFTFSLSLGFSFDKERDKGRKRGAHCHVSFPRQIAHFRKMLATGSSSIIIKCRDFSATDR